MSLTIESDATDIYDCENLNDAVGVEAVLDELLIKRNSRSLSVSTERYKTRSGYCGHIEDLTDKHFRLWYLGISFPNIDIKRNGGVSLYVTDKQGGLAFWNIVGKESYYGGWINVVVHMSSTPDVGSVDLTNIKEIGMTHRSIDGERYLTIPNKQRNVWLDYMRISEGLTCYGRNWGTRDVSFADSAPGVGFGIVIHEKGAECVYGSLVYGKLTEVTDYKDDGVTIIFTDSIVRDSLYGLKLIGDETYLSDFEITNSVFISNLNKYFLDLDDDKIHELIFTNNHISNASTIHFLANLMYSTVTGNIFNSCDSIHPQGSRFENNSINSTTADLASLYLETKNAVAASKNIIYTRYQNKFALHLSAEITGVITLDGHIFDQTGLDIYWAGTEGTLIIKLINNSNPTSYNTAGGDIEFETVNQLTVDYDAIRTILEANSGALMDMVTNSNENLNQMLISMGDSISENKSVIVSKSGNTQLSL